MPLFVPALFSDVFSYEVLVNKILMHAFCARSSWCLPARWTGFLNFDDQ
tara:strand:+ start:113470 stop:113616 length:147 start_codon:yes stop_codon:yes gene_type:complete